MIFTLFLLARRREFRAAFRRYRPSSLFSAIFDGCATPLFAMTGLPPYFHQPLIPCRWLAAIAAIRLQPFARFRQRRCFRELFCYFRPIFPMPKRHGAYDFSALSPFRHLFTRASAMLSAQIRQRALLSMLIHSLMLKFARHFVAAYAGFQFRLMILPTFFSDAAPDKFRFSSPPYAARHRRIRKI